MLVCEIQKECSMSYRQSEMYKLTTYLKDLPLQSVSSKRNLQVCVCSYFIVSGGYKLRLSHLDSERREPDQLQFAILEC